MTFRATEITLLLLLLLLLITTTTPLFLQQFLLIRTKRRVLFSFWFKPHMVSVFNDIRDSCGGPHLSSAEYFS